MKFQILLFFIAFSVMSTSLIAQREDYHNYRLKIGSRYYAADSSISLGEVRAARAFILEDKNSNPPRRAAIDSCHWSITYRSGTKNITSREEGTYKVNVGINYPEPADRPKLQPGDVFLLQDITVAGSNKLFPKLFRLFFK